MSGAELPDLPAEEAEAFATLAAERDFQTVLLVTPTTPRVRATRIVKLCRGFVYCVSVAGITGERDRLPAALVEQLHWLRNETDLPLCVGFGVSRPEHVEMLRGAADGVIVGTAVVRAMAGDPATIGERVAAVVGPLVRAAHGA